MEESDGERAALCALTIGDPLFVRSDGTEEGFNGGPSVQCSNRLPPGPTEYEYPVGLSPGTQRERRGRGMVVSPTTMGDTK